MDDLTESKAQTQQFWDKNPCGSAATWEQARDLRFAVTDPYLVEFLTGPALSQKNVLEIGCGQGLDASMIVKRCKTYVGIDLSPESVRIAEREVNQRKPDNVTVDFMQGDAERLSFPDDSFDAVYSIGVLHHTAGFDQAISEIYRVMQQDGTLILMLYRSYTPLWVVLRVIRGFFRIPLVGKKLRASALNALRKKDQAQNAESTTGTALLELIGCPIIDTYTYRGLRSRLRHDYEIDSVSYHRTGIDQVVRILPLWLQKKWPQTRIKKLDDVLSQWFGFYLFLTATKKRVG